MSNDTAHPKNAGWLTARDVLPNVHITTRPTDDEIRDAVRKAVVQLSVPGGPSPADVVSALRERMHRIREASALGPATPEYARPEHAYECHCGRVLDFRVDKICPCVPPEESAARVAAILLSDSAGDAFEVCADIPHRCLGGEK